MTPFSLLVYICCVDKISLNSPPLVLMVRSVFHDQVTKSCDVFAGSSDCRCDSMTSWIPTSDQFQYRMTYITRWILTGPYDVRISAEIPFLVCRSSISSPSHGNESFACFSHKIYVGSKAHVCIDCNGSRVILIISTYIGTSLSLFIYIRNTPFDISPSLATVHPKTPCCLGNTNAHDFYFSYDHHTHTQILLNHDKYQLIHRSQEEDTRCSNGREEGIIDHRH